MRHRPRTAKPGPVRRTAAALAAVVVGLLALPAPAHASSPAAYDYAYPGGSIPSGETGAASGLTYTDTGPQGSVFNASLGSMWIEDPISGSPLRTFCSLYGTAFGAQGPWTEEALTSQSAARVAWAISAFSGRSPSGDAAVQDLIHVFFTNTQDRVLKILNATPSGAATLAEAQRMWEASAPYTGSYRTSPAIQPGAAGAGTVSNTQIASATGTISVPIELTLAGNAVFDSTGTQTYAGTSGDTPSFHAVNGGGRVSVTETSASISSTLRQFSSPGNQTQLTAAAPAIVSGTAKEVEIWGSFQPQAGSTAPQYVNVGGMLTDTLHITTAKGGNDWIPGVGARFDVEWLYYPSKQQPDTAVPEGATSLGVGTAIAERPGDLIVRGPRADKAGYYYPVVRFALAHQPADQQHYFTGDWAAGFSDPGEQSVVRYSPQVLTKTSAISEGLIADTLTVTGIHANQKLNVVSELILTSECAAGGGADKAPADAQLIRAITTQVTGNGTVTTEAVAVPWAKIVNLWAEGKSACLSWRESIEPTESTEAWNGKYLDPAETVVLEKPAITTQASSHGTVPLESHDTGKVSGTIPSGHGVQTQTKVDQFKFDDSTDGSAQAVCVNPSYASGWLDVPPGTTTVTYPTHTIDHAGTYGYVETLKITVDGKDTFVHQGTCGAKAETVIATAAGQPVAEQSMAPPAQPVAEQPAPSPALAAPVVNAGNLPPTSGPSDALPGGPFVPLAAAGALAVVIAACIGGMTAIHRRRGVDMRAGSRCAE